MLEGPALEEGRDGELVDRKDTPIVIRHALPVAESTVFRSQPGARVHRTRANVEHPEELRPGGAAVSPMR